MIPRSLRRLVTGTGRRARPLPMASAVLVMVVVGVAAAEATLWVWATRPEPPARTLATAATLLPRPVPLDSALAVTWTWSVGGTAALEAGWRRLVAPDLPPGICLSGDDAGTGGAVDAALRQLDLAVRRRAAVEELERRILELREAGAVRPSGRPDFVVRYGLARGYAAAGDFAAAARVLEPVFEEHVSEARVPETTRGLARRRAAEGRVDRTLVSDAIHARYLAGTVAYHRGEPTLAVGYFRRALNAVHYLLAVDRAGELGVEGHQQRVAIPLRGSACEGSEGELTSLDAYAGLVASYMADESFRDPWGLPREVARTRLDLDAQDPFAPVLRLAAVVAGEERTPIPENLLWAASNLQRVYHHNRLRPDPRLEVTRAVLLLLLTREERFMGPIRSMGGGDACTMLAALGGDLHRDAAALEVAGRSRSPVDSARAAVAVQTFARLEGECGGRGAPALDARVRSAWIRRGGHHLTRGLGGLFEDLRVEIAGVMATPGAPARTLETRLTPPVEKARSHLRLLDRGRVPPELPADLAVEPSGRFVEEWWAALFVDVSRALVRAARPASGPVTVQAGRVPEFLRSLHSAARHGGIDPDELYAAGELEPLARTAGTGTWIAYRIRYGFTSSPGTALALLLLVLLLVAFSAVAVHVNAWRYRLLLRERRYAAELREGSARA